MRTDNETAKGFIKGLIKQKQSRTFDRQFWWLKDRVAQLQFNVMWDPGIYNLADYFTKHHSGSHHACVRPIYLYKNNSPNTLQGCIKIMDSGTHRVTRATKDYPTPVTKGNKISGRVSTDSHIKNNILAKANRTMQYFLKTQSYATHQFNAYISDVI